MTGGRGRPPASPKSFDRNRIENPSRVDVAHLESEKPTQRNECEVLGAVDCKGPDAADAPYGANPSNHSIGSRTCHHQVIRVSRPHVDAGAIRAHHRVMRADPSTIDGCPNLSAVGVDNFPDAPGG